MNLYPVFVYGTLRRGGSNHRFLAGQRFVATARTQPRFRLFEAGGYPGMVIDEHRPLAVEGEIWHVDAACLRELDRLEGVDEGLYARAPIPLQPPFDRETVQGYLYLPPVDPSRDLGAVWREPTA